LIDAAIVGQAIELLAEFYDIFVAVDPAVEKAELVDNALLGVLDGAKFNFHFRILAIPPREVAFDIYKPSPPINDGATLKAGRATSA
jgi:hypothetical protein